MKNFKSKLFNLRKTGDHFILASGVGLLISLGMLALIVAVILVKGLGVFWPHQLVEARMKNGKVFLGEHWEKSTEWIEDNSGRRTSVREIQLKIGNRDIYGRDFVWLKVPEIDSLFSPPDGVVFERMENGNFYGFISGLQLPDRKLAVSQKEFWKILDRAHRLAWKKKEEVAKLNKELQVISEPLSLVEHEIAQFENTSAAATPAGRQKLARLEARADSVEAAISKDFSRVNGTLAKLKNDLKHSSVAVKTVEGQEHQLHLSEIVRFYRPNRMNRWQKSALYAGRLWEFLSADPRESNTEGGVFPAIFGTVIMVLLMSVAVVPLGVLAAIYLNEYARQGALIRLIRLSVNNLAGVPSIVFGVFGLGFFVYVLGGTIDQLFFSSKLPTPTFGTGGILWASLTLALLTLPVVVVATEEGLRAVPLANKEGALALGATRWQMIRKVALPNALPGILTGVILAISRGAGEVAPLMITGVVKLAPTLPLDGTFPFFHLDRKFMHLGFHIYDLGFQSPNVEAAKPSVYMTALLLILIVILLNLLAIYFRNRMKKRFRSATF